jgi:hypothetical protein
MSEQFNAIMQSSFLMTVKLSGRFPIFSGLFESFVAFHANPLPARNALVVVKKSQTIPLHLRIKPTCLPCQSEHSLSTNDTFSIFDGCRSAALREQDRIFHGAVL